MKINQNIQAMVTSNILTTNESRLATSSEKLSSGYKINHAKENPAGLAISNKMKAQIRGLERASQNASNGISVIETAEGALAEIQSMVQRINELSVQAANGTNVSLDKKAVQKEVDQLCNEIERIAADTEYNSQNLLGGAQELKGYTDNDAVKVRFYSDDVKAKLDYQLKFSVAADGSISASTVTGIGGFSDTAKVTYENGTATITDMNNFEVQVDVDEAGITADVDVKLDITGIGGMTFQVGANEGQEITVTIPEISLKNMGLEGIDCSTEEGARDAMDRAAVALDFISEVRSKLGAYQNRFEHTISSLNITDENMTAANSRMMDVDMATEMVEYTKMQVLAQAGTSMLAQANERPQSALQLLQ